MIEYDENMIIGQNGRELAFFCPHCKTHIRVIAEPRIVRCKDCKYWEHTPENATSYWKPCDEIKTEPHYYCWCGEWKE